MSTSDLTTNAFFQALIRMISRRGLCKSIWSDNAKTFKSADRQFQQLFTQESSADRRRRHKIHQEGLQDKLTFWESNGGSLSNVPLGVVAGERGCSARFRARRRYPIKSWQPHLPELKQLLTRSRPFTTESDDGDLTPVTPDHRAHGRSLLSLSDIADEVSANEGTTRQRYLYRQKLLHHFWQRWRGEYLSQLSIRYQWVCEQPALVVLISERNV